MSREVPFIPTGSMALDAALGIGGLPRVRGRLPDACQCFPPACLPVCLLLLACSVPVLAWHTSWRTQSSMALRHPELMHEVFRPHACRVPPACLLACLPLACMPRSCPLALMRESFCPSQGRVVEIYGPEASGKTTLALHCVAECQKRGGTAVYIDAEHALDASYVAALGVDVDALLISQPDSGEQALSVADTVGLEGEGGGGPDSPSGREGLSLHVREAPPPLISLTPSSAPSLCLPPPLLQFIRSASVDLVVIDSVAALVPKAELEGEIGDPHMALQGEGGRGASGRGWRGL